MSKKNCSDHSLFFDVAFCFNKDIKLDAIKRVKRKLKGAKGSNLDFRHQEIK